MDMFILIITVCVASAWDDCSATKQIKFEGVTKETCLQMKKLYDPVPTTQSAVCVLVTKK